MQSLLMITATICVFIALIIFFQSLNNAFKQGFLWGIGCLLFPIGSYFYYKKFRSIEKNNGIWLIICLSIALLTFLMAKLL
jgi:hypothetical protein